jgi:predicted RNA binding protein YcfA (HicA-like mRNA interferase family)
MGKLPVVSGDAAVKAFSKFGYQVSHQTGSHMILRRTEPPHRHLSVPRHKELGKGLLRGLLRDAGITVDEFIKTL